MINKKDLEDLDKLLKNKTKEQKKIKNRDWERIKRSILNQLPKPKKKSRKRVNTYK